MRPSFFGLLVLLGLYVAALYVPLEPQERRPGTRLAGPEALAPPTPWDGQKKILVETRTWYRIRHSVTTIAWMRAGTIYVPCGDCAGKLWPRHVASEPRVRLKIDGRLYRRRAVEVTDPEEVRWVLRTPTVEEPPAGLVLYRMDEAS